MRVIVEGYPQTGKSALVQFIMEKLREIGVEGDYINPEHPLRERAAQDRIISTLRGTTVELVERQISFKEPTRPPPSEPFRRG